MMKKPTKKSSKKLKRVFEGSDAIKTFLAPGSMGFTPIVELPKNLNPIHKDGVRIFIKLMQFSPLSNIKSIPAYTMLAKLSDDNLRKIKNLVEYSSGNTALSLSILSRHLRICTR